nr:disease resistance protein RPH8A-like isoform X1 [Ipomoea batatas]
MSTKLRIAERIVFGCTGLPLEVVVIAGLLVATKESLEIWRDVAETLDRVDRYDNEKRISKILSLSYNYLPPHLKPCFHYFGVFPEDNVIPFKRLINLWVAEGFLMPHKKMSLEEVAGSYLHDLINRGLVQINELSIDGKVKSCKVHDRVHEELGIFIEGQLEPSYLGNLVCLHRLEKLKVKVGRVERFCLPTGFPPNLKKLTLRYTYLPWKEMDTIGELRHLEVLKLKDFAFSGSKWEPSKRGFRKLKALLISQSNLKHWTASSNHFPILERLVLKYCWELKQIPIDFANIGTLKLIVLECCCYSSLVTSANQISSAKSETLKGKEDCPLRVRKVGTKVELPIIESFEEEMVESSEEESVKSSEEESVESSKEEMLKADNSVMKYLKMLFRWMH